MNKTNAKLASGAPAQSEIASSTQPGKVPQPGVAHAEHILRPSLLNLAEVECRVGFKRSKIYELMYAGQFPKAVKIGIASRWRDTEIDEWIKHLPAIGSQFEELAGQKSNRQTSANAARIEPERPTGKGRGAGVQPDPQRYTQSAHAAAISALAAIVQECEKPRTPRGTGSYLPPHLLANARAALALLDGVAHD